MSQTLETVLFDLDGTLIDSIELIRRSYVHTVAAHGLPERDATFWLAGLGRPLRWQFAQFTSDAAEIEAMVATYRAYNLAHHDALVTAFPGAVEAVASLHSRGIKLGIVTSKFRAGATKGLRWCGYDERWFGSIVGADDVSEHKPHPAPVLKALADLGVTAERAVMVGDSPHDLSSGRSAGTQTAAVSWGPFSREELLATNPDHWLEETAHIARLG